MEIPGRDEMMFDLLFDPPLPNGYEVNGLLEINISRGTYTLYNSSKTEVKQSGVCGKINNSIVRDVHRKLHAWSKYDSVKDKDAYAIATLQFLCSRFNINHES